MNSDKESVERRYAEALARANEIYKLASSTESRLQWRRYIEDLKKDRARELLDVEVV